MAYVFRRIATSAAMLLLASILIFVILRALPGDPVLARLGASPGVTQETLDRLREEAGLEDPLIFQYLGWVKGALTGDLGMSYFSNAPVAELISTRMWPTLQLTVMTVVLAVLIAVPAAILATRRPHGLADRTIAFFSSVGMAFPPFIAGIILIIVFAVTLKLLPARGYVPFFEDPIGNLSRMILPALALTVAASPLVFRHLRSTLNDALRSPFSRTAAGKGGSATRVVLQHALPNASIPSLTMVGLIFGYTLGGSVIVEYAFGISGLGTLSIEAAFRRDYAVLQSTVLFAAAMFILVALLVDLLIYRLDPRLKVSNG
ncbi:ABC transporter permease [Microbacterium sp. NC79]|uniref:ABC transporter permease n=1 Tax=Microbacterium sp. NC79 TaxID=2851009 RepID=UPI001C2C7F33|nr:ABC transporter permease [Microbacterium sp. NC79]MBV0896218.1 ABC transporter permease [Microbacterium sp. NC79]